jgi:hypothetical protein
MSKHITQIPFPGSSGAVPTGALQFQNDWTGLFLRGDSASSLLSTIRGLQQRLGSHPDSTVGALLIQLGQVADIIEQTLSFGRRLYDLFQRPVA